jgi:hypothetical protein
MIAFVCTLSLLLCVALAQQCNNDVEVALAGDVRIAGAVFQGGRRWLGVRFGVAPRFQRPRVPPQLPAGTVVNATLQSLACPKFPLFGGPAPFTSVAPEGEDCLFLDIYAPTRDCSAAPQALPVIFWVRFSFCLFRERLFNNLVDRSRAVVSWRAPRTCTPAQGWRAAPRPSW